MIMGIYKRSYSNGTSVYYARLRYRGKRYLSRAFPSKELARIEEGRLLDAKRRGRLMEEFGPDAKTESPKLKAIVPDYLEACAHHNTPSTLKRKRGIFKHVRKDLGSKALDEITTFDIERYKARRRKKVKGPTVNRELATLSHLMGWARRLGYVATNPVSDVKRFPENEDAWAWLTDDEIGALLEACKQERAKAPHLFPIILLALDTGLRKGELLALRWDDLDLSRRQLHVRRRKTKSRSMIPMTKRAAAALRTIRRRGPYIFAHPDGSLLGNVRRSFDTALKRAGLDRIRWHDLRHTFASRLVQRNANLFEVQELMGHRSLAMTRRYSHLSTQRLRDAVDLLEKPPKTGEGRTGPRPQEELSTAR